MGWNNQVVQLLVISEAATGYSGIFIYTPAPGPGNLLISIASVAGTDPYGNYYPAGFNDSAPGGSQAAINITDGQIALTDVAGNTWGMYPAVIGGSPYLNFWTPGSGNGAMYLDTNGNIHSNSGFIANTPEQWNTVPLDAGWSTLAGHSVPRYRLLPTYEVELDGFAQHANFVAPQNLNGSNNMPNAYSPQQEKYVKTGDANRCGVMVNTSGTIIGYPVAGGSTEIELAGITYPLGV
jgi:hypothetical protein